MNSVSSSVYFGGRFVRSIRPLIALGLVVSALACKSTERATARADASTSAVAPGPPPPDVAGPPADALTSGTGLASKVLTTGTGTAHPVLNDSVKVTFAGWTPDGAPFLSGDDVTFHLARAIPGWAEAIQQMVVGEKRRLWVPPKLAYQGRRDAPLGRVVFDLQLLEIIPGPQAPPDLRAPPADAMRLQDGLATRVVAAGRGKVHPAINDIVTLSFASWTTDGAPFLRAEQVPVTVGRSIPGWREALPLMVAGEKRRLWLPPALAYDGQKNAPTGLVVFDLELIDITQGPKAPSYVWNAPEDARTSKDGLASKVVVPGQGRVHPRLNDGVRVHFTAWDRDGRLKDASGATPDVRPVSKEFRGWAEGLQQMVVGETRILWIPASLEPELGPGAPPPSDMTLLVELVEILAPPKTPPDVRGPPRKAIIERDGLASKVLAKGTGTSHPDRSTSVTLHYAGWTTDGKLFSTSYTSGKPVTVSVGDSIPGWTEALELMVEGEKRRVWIPKQLANKGRDGPKGMLVFDIELLKIVRDDPL